MEDKRVFACCHNHSCFSDAEYTPEHIAELAHSLGHGGIILTDHDTVKGTYFMDKAARKLGMKSILGCEFTTRHKGKPVHLLGFDFNPDNAKMKELLAYTSGCATDRSKAMFELGIQRGTLRDGITWQDVQDAFPYNDYIVNDQVFVVMVEKGIYKPEEYNEFFMNNFSYSLGIEPQIYEITGKSYNNVITENVVKIILEAGGVPVVAHPCGLVPYVQDFLNMGVMGFEFRHPDLMEVRCGEKDLPQLFKQICEDNNLYKMGGGDHSGILGGNLDRDPMYDIPEYYTGICEEDFMNIYERKLG